MSEWTTEKFAQRVVDVGLLDPARSQAVWSELGSRDVSLEEYQSLLLRKQLLTRLQIERILNHETTGFFYGKYKLLYLVGKGTFARVYRAEHIEKHEVVAVKVLRNQFLNDPERRDHFLREANLVMPLRHPNIVPIYAVSTERNRPYMVMEFVEGQNLRDFLKVRKRFDVESGLRLAADIAGGLDFAATRNVTHRDLKLSNVLVTSSGRAKLVDFGLAAIAEAARDSKSSTTGSQRSIDYAGLERVTGVKKDDPRSDIYFAGCIFYHLLSGEPPLVETRERTQRLNAARYREVKPILSSVPDLPGPVVAMISRAMELNADKRFQTPGELLAEIKSVQRQLRGEEPEGGEGGSGRAVQEREGEGHSVMIVEGNIEMQDALRDLLKRRGYRVLVIGDCRRALTRWEEANERPAECVIFSTLEFGEEAIDAFNRFGELSSSHDTAAILFVDEKHRSAAARAQHSAHRVLLPLPLKVRQLRATLLGLLKPNAGPLGGNEAFA
jgi:tRNA A-37 threonylcarbamoyl transferase component Bud32/CheY-like chemotaxis protein